MQVKGIERETIPCSVKCKDNISCSRMLNKCSFECFFLNIYFFMYFCNLKLNVKVA